MPISFERFAHAVFPFRPDLLILVLKIFLWVGGLLFNWSATLSVLFRGK